MSVFTGVAQNKKTPENIDGRISEMMQHIHAIVKRVTEHTILNSNLEC